MDELEISGKRYISSARAAKEHKYHADYIGQLVRGGKVVGQKVGRAWYIDAQSLAEYFDKEVPARGPVEKKAQPVARVEDELVAKVEIGRAEEVPVAEHESSFKEAESEVRGTSSDPDKEPFALPFRKSGRQHVIEALDSDIPKKEIKKEEPVERVVEEIKEEIESEIGFTEELVPEMESPYVAETTENSEEDEEETYIPVKITAKRVEPEDSFYKVSSKGLKYVPAKKAATPRYEEPRVVAQAPSVKLRKNQGSLVSAASLVLVAGIVSLGAGVLMSYYLHSVTTVEGAGQSSTVLLSN